MGLKCFPVGTTAQLAQLCHIVISFQQEASCCPDEENEVVPGSGALPSFIRPAVPVCNGNFEKIDVNSILRKLSHKRLHNITTQISIRYRYYLDILEPRSIINQDAEILTALENRI